MKVYNKVVISKTDDNKYKYNCQILSSANGKDWFYCGNGKFFETKKEARAFKRNNANK